MKKHLAVILSVLLALGTASPVSAAKLKKNQVENIAAREEQAAMDAVSGPAAGENGDKPSEVTGNNAPGEAVLQAEAPTGEEPEQAEAPTGAEQETEAPSETAQETEAPAETAQETEAPAGTGQETEPQQSREERRERISGPSLPPATPIRTAAGAPTVQCPERSIQSPQTGMSFRPGPGSASVTAISFTLWRTPGCTETGSMSIIPPTARPGAMA